MSQLDEFMDESPKAKSLLLDILFELEAAIWDAHGEELAVLAQAESALDAHIEDEARELERAAAPAGDDDIPF